MTLSIKNSGCAFLIRLDLMLSMSLWMEFKLLQIIKPNLIKNTYPLFLIDKVIINCLDYKFSSNQNQLTDKSDVHYFKLPYISNLLHHIKNKLSKLCKEFCKENFKIKLVFNSFKINFFLHVKTQFLMIWNLFWYITLLC